jgi:hypothetical protein
MLHVPLRARAAALIVPAAEAMPKDRLRFGSQPQALSAQERLNRPNGLHGSQRRRAAMFLPANEPRGHTHIFRIRFYDGALALLRRCWLLGRAGAAPCVPDCARMVEPPPSRLVQAATPCFDCSQILQHQHRAVSFLRANVGESVRGEPGAHGAIVATAERAICPGGLQRLGTDAVAPAFP